MTEPGLVPYLPWIRAFEAAARRLNFTEAGTEIGLTQAAVSQQMRLLESALGKQLFERQRRGVKLTAAGAALLPHVQSTFRSLARSVDELFGIHGAVHVDLRSPISFAALWLAPRLRRLARELPKLVLNVHTIHLPGDYDGAGSTDLDIRFGTGQFPGRTAYRLTEERLVPVASREILRQLKGREWRELPLIGVVGAREMWLDWFEAAGFPPPRGSLYRFDTFIAAMEAAKSGAGVLLGSRPLVDRALQRKELVMLSDIQLSSDGGHYLTHEAGAALDSSRVALLNWFRATS
jgi:DNA-binding transcriptional LysR family regulator